MEYTKGEWKVDKFKDGRVEVVSPSEEVVICQVFKVDQEANAQLIASAPDGLNAGIDAYIALLRTGGTFRVGIQGELCQLRDFIAKATNRNAEEVQNEYESKALAKAEGK